MNPRSPDATPTSPHPDPLPRGRGRLRSLIANGHPVDPLQLEGWAYRGTALGLPRVIERLTWKTFQKTFHREPRSGRLLGWNVRVHQDGVGAPSRPLLRDGVPWTTWHYEVRSPEGLRTPPGFDRGLVIDYGLGNNPALDTIRFSKDPLVALVPGDMSRLLGVTWLSLGPLQLETPTYFLLEREHRISYVPPEAIAAPRGPMFGFERRWAELLFSATLGTDLDTIDRTHFWEKLARDPPPYFAPGLRAAVHALTFLPLTLRDFRRPFYALTPAQQRACISRLAEDPRASIKQLVSTLKLLACFALFEDPATRARLGGATP